MFNLYPTKKLTIFSSLDAHSSVDNEREYEPLKNWYAGIAGTGFHGSYLVLYVHKPSLLTVVVKGKSIQETYSHFLERLEKLLLRFSFPESFIQEALQGDYNYALFKPYDSHYISQVNQFTKLLAYLCSKNSTYGEIDIDAMENKLMCHIYQYNSSRSYPPPLLYWEQKLGFKSQKIKAI